MKKDFRIQILDKELIILDKDKYNEFIEKNNNKYAIITIDTDRQRTLNQNSYYWGVVIKIICEEVGENSEYMHEILKDMFAPRKFIKSKLGLEIETKKDTKSMTTKEFEKYLEDIRIFMNRDYSIKIPLPNETFFKLI